MDNALNTASRDAFDVFLEKLRTSTANSHKSLERLPLSASILSPTISVDEYGNYLSRMLNVIAETENHIFPIVAHLFQDLDDRKKSKLIQNDLNAIGVAPTVKKFSFDSASHYSVPFALGVFYVVEGSTLGGRFILKNIESSLGLNENHGASYFSGYGNKTGSYWKNFLNILASFQQQNDADEEIIAGAESAFQSIHNHFSYQS